MIKLIFLDIDGVIATPDYVKEGLWALNPEKQKLLGEIIKATGAKIVLSSSWRKLTLEDTKEYMAEEGFEFVNDIIGVTIRAYQYIKKIENEKGIHLSIPRGVEIKQWIDTNIHSENGKNYQHKKLGIDYTYIILDDDSDMLLEQSDNFIHTRFDVGLTEEIVKQSIKILNNGN